jgi:hypothetical protein
VTEAEWLACDDPVALGEVALGGKRASARLLRLHIAAYWRWLEDRECPQAERQQVREALAILERWAETGIEPPKQEQAESFIWFAEEMPEAFRYTIGTAVFVLEPGQHRAKWATWTLRDIFGNPFRPVAFSPEWQTDTAVSLAHQMYEARDFSAMPVLADALQDAGCDNAEPLPRAGAARSRVLVCRSGTRESVTVGAAAPAANRSFTTARRSSLPGLMSSPSGRVDTGVGFTDPRNESVSGGRARHGSARSRCLTPRREQRNA